MTSPAYCRDVQWTPLADRDRTWERKARYIGESHARSRNADHCLEEPADFATEAAYLPPNDGMKREVRPTAPRLKADHIWGVRDDWGKGNNTWGQGAKAYDIKQKASRTEGRGA
jgi:protein AFG1